MPNSFFLKLFCALNEVKEKKYTHILKYIRMQILKEALSFALPFEYLNLHSKYNINILFLEFVI